MNAKKQLINRSVTNLYPTYLISVITMQISGVIDSLCASRFIKVNGVAAMGIVTPAIVLFWLFINTVARAVPVSMAVPAIQCIIISLLLILVNLTIVNLYIAQGKSRIASIVNLITHFIMPVLCGFILTKSYGAKGMWISFIAAQALSLICLYVLNMIHQKKAGLSFEDVITFGEDYSDVAQNQRSLSFGPGKDRPEKAEAAGDASHESGHDEAKQ